MQNTPLPLSRDLVLIGGGHTHALVLRKWGMAPLPGVRLTVINPAPTAPYSGMLPGFLAGHYQRDALNIDLVRLARFAGARIILGAASSIDLQAQTIMVSGYPPISYDLASLDVGITSAMPAVPGFTQHAVPAKPLDDFARAWSDFKDQTGPADVAIIGGGVAGVEIAMAFAFALKNAGRNAKVNLIDRGSVLSAMRPKSRQTLIKAMGALCVETHENTEISEITSDGVLLADGRTIPAKFVCGAAGAKLHDWISSTTLDLHQGFVKVSEHLLSSDPNIFAVGDCAHMVKSPRPKAGVFAVRQAETLFENLRIRLREKGTLQAYRPQKDYLKLISLGGKSAVGDRFGLSFQGPAIWKWKNRIDQTFMNQFRDLPKMAQPTHPKDRAAGSFEVLGGKPMCGGCGSKVGRGALQAAVARIKNPDRPDIQNLAAEDCAVLITGGVQQVISTDHLRAMNNDPVVMTRIAANHALGDIWAMGAKPQAATATLILPYMSAALAERTLGEIMETAQTCFTAAGAAIVGGHSSLGSELTIGFTITGLCDKAPITLGGARPGDSLILTKPIGTGVIMAAEMAGNARGEWVSAAFDHMSTPQGQAAEILAAANAMTDVTGFGLAGHLMNICEQSGVGATLQLTSIPLLAGALTLSKSGTRSTLFPQNRRVLPDLAPDPLSDLLFDPQTAGGLLAAVPGDPAPQLKALQIAGFDAALIGKVTSNTGQISIE